MELRSAWLGASVVFGSWALVDGLVSWISSHCVIASRS